MAEKTKKSLGTGAVSVIQDVRRVDIKETDINDAKAFAEKYDMKLDEDHDPSEGIGGHNESYAIQDIMQNKDLVQRTDTLVRRLDEKTREVERLNLCLKLFTVV